MTADHFTLKQRFNQSSRYFMMGSVVLALFVLIGWEWNVAFIKYPFPNTPTMNPMSAVSFILLGIAFFIITSHQSSRQKNFIAGGLSTVVIVIGVLKLLDLVFGTSFEIDTILFSDQLLPDENGIIINRMAPNTAFNFILLGAALILSQSPTHVARAGANYATGIVLLITLFSIIGYVYQVKEFKGVLSYIPMALQTAIAFKLAGLAVLFMNSDRGFMTVITSPFGGGTIARLLIPTAILAPIFIGYIKLLRQWNSPIPEELGVAFLITGIVLLFLMLILIVSFIINKNDILRKQAEDKLSQINFDLEQKVAERSKEIYSNEKRYRSLIENSADGITLLDHTLTPIHQSPAVTAMTGYTLEERKGKELIHPDDRPKAAQMFMELMKFPHKPLSFQYRTLHRNGQYRWIEGVASNLLADEDVKAVVVNYRDVTARKEAEAKLEASEQGLRALLENSADALVITDENLLAKYQSPSAERMTGVSLEYRRANPNVRFTHPDDVPRLQRAVAEILKHPETPLPFQLRFRHKKKNYIWIEGVMTNLLHDKNVNGITFTYRDVTDRKKFEEQQALLASIVYSSNDAIFSKDLKGIILTWNRGAEIIFGYTAGEAVGMPAAMIVPDENLAEEIEIVNKIKEGGSIERYETKRSVKGGRQIEVSITVSPLRDDHGTVIGASTIAQDISERKEAELKIAANEQRFKALIENIADAIVINDEHSNILYQSPSVTRILGYTAEERKSKRVLEYVHPDFRNMFEELYKKLANSPGEALPFQYKFLHKQGHYIWLEGVVTNLINDPSVNAYVANYRDITDRKETEEKILKLNSELEERVADRTQQLQSVNKELEAFTYSVSHDLRAPLRIMNGFGQILMEDHGANFNPEGQKILDRIMKNSKKMGQLIDDLLDFSRLGRAEMAMSVIDMNVLVREVLEELTSGGTNIPEQLHIMHLPPATGDYRLMKQVWTNLISNAIKYSSKKTNPVITIGIKQDPEKVIYYIKDNGNGFDMTYYSKLFGVFQRLHKESEFAGTGVGLALVQRIIKRHEGNVWAEGKPDEGATFYFNLSTK